MPLILALWNDDSGALVSMEFLFVATVVVLGVIVGLVTMRQAVTIELVELANATLGLSQEYSFGGSSGCCSSIEGSVVTDSPGGPLTVDLCVNPPAAVAVDIAGACTP